MVVASVVAALALRADAEARRRQDAAEADTTAAQQRGIEEGEASATLSGSRDAFAQR